MIKQTIALFATSVLGLLLFIPGHINADDKVTDATVKKAMEAAPNLQNGKKLYFNCALCHTPEGWGSPDGRYPQIAGQHKNVILKQLADIHNNNRDNPTMYPFSELIFAKGPQALADVSAYIEQLPMVPNNGQGFGDNLIQGKQLYTDNCQKCHGDNGEGDAIEFYPRIHGQQYQYILRQMLWIKQGKRRNANKKMVQQLEGFDLKDIMAVSDYVSRLQPDKALLADRLDWRNPDFKPSYISVPRVREELNHEN